MRRTRRRRTTPPLGCKAQTTSLESTCQALRRPSASRSPSFLRTMTRVVKFASLVLGGLAEDTSIGVVAAAMYEMQGRARLFDAQECRTEIAAQQRWSSVCQSDTALLSRLCGGEMQRWLPSNISVSASAGGGKFLYVRNQKAASMFWTHDLDFLVGARPIGDSRIKIRASRVINQSIAQHSFIFSMVREPLQTALDGYLTVRNKAAKKPEEQQFITRLFNNTRGADSCVSPRIATELADSWWRC